MRYFDRQIMYLYFVLFNLLNMFPQDPKVQVRLNLTYADNDSRLHHNSLKPFLLVHREERVGLDHNKSGGVS